MPRDVAAPGKATPGKAAEAEAIRDPHTHPREGDSIRGRAYILDVLATDRRGLDVRSSAPGEAPMVHEVTRATWRRLAAGCEVLLKRGEPLGGPRG